MVIRALGLLAVALSALLLGPAPAYAADAAPAPTARFDSPGRPVYPLDALGLGCRLLGRCGGAAAALDERGIPTYLSLRRGEAVTPICRGGDVVRVAGFFDGPDGMVEGWVLTGDVDVTGPLDDC